MTPTGMNSHGLPNTNPRTTNTATTSKKTPTMYGMSRLSSLRCIWNACQSCV
ncbi:Uncharacterised protein [Mycobacteroides abscessus subsp. abscessus]|nr:Uncharacterised protein [Mycobacteroides abscessus subsp. abscessus]